MIKNKLIHDEVIDKRTVFKINKQATALTTIGCLYIKKKDKHFFETWFMRGICSVRVNPEILIKSKVYTHSYDTPFLICLFFIL